MMKSCVIALLVLTAATSASASDKASKDAKAEVPDKDKVVCKTERGTGSLINKRRICMTRQQWDDQAAAARKGMDEVVRNAGRGSQSSSQNGGM